MSNNHIIEEYKTLRQEILEMYKRQNSYVLYTVVATATIFGFAIEYPSPFVFLLPLIIIIPLSYKTVALDGSILSVGTYISVAIESKLKDLQWETYQQKRRDKKENKKRIKRSLSGYLLFDSLIVLCVVLSIGYTLLIDKNIQPFIYNLLSGSGELLITIGFPVFLWFIVLMYLGWLTLKFRDAYSSENQRRKKEEIVDILNQIEIEQKSHIKNRE